LEALRRPQRAAKAAFLYADFRMNTAEVNLFFTTKETSRTKNSLFEKGEELEIEIASQN